MSSKPLLANTSCHSPFRPPLPVGSSKCSHERPWLGACSTDPRIQGTRATARPAKNPIFLPSSRPARGSRSPPEERCELPSNAPGWRRPGPSVAFSRCWIPSKSRAGPASAPGRKPNRGASGIWTNRPNGTTTNLHRTLRFSWPAPSAPRSQDPRVCPGGPSVLESSLSSLS